MFCYCCWLLLLLLLWSPSSSSSSFNNSTYCGVCHYVSSRHHDRGDRAVHLGLFAEADRATDLRREYGDLGMTVEVVDGMDSAIRHIHTYGR